MDGETGTPMEVETVETSGPSGFTEESHIIVTEGFELVLFPSGTVLMQGDNVIRLGPTEALAIAGAIMLGYGGSESAVDASDE